MNSSGVALRVLRTAMIVLILYGTWLLGTSALLGPGEVGPKKIMLGQPVQAGRDEVPREKSYDVDWGGEKSTTNRSISEKSPATWLGEYRLKIEKEGGRVEYFQAGEVQAAAGFRTRQGVLKHVQAFKMDSGRTICHESESSPTGAGPADDHEVEWPFSIPENCEKIFVIQDRHDGDSVVALYSSKSQDLQECIEEFRAGFAKESWKEDSGLYDEPRREELEAMLSFSRGGLNCLLGLTMVEAEGQVYISILLHKKMVVLR